MQTPNITNPKFSTIINDAFYNELKFPILPYGKKMFTIRDEKLIAIRFLYSILIFDKEQNEIVVKVAYNIATEPKKTFLTNITYSTSILYESVEDYDNGIRYQTKFTDYIPNLFKINGFLVGKCGAFNAQIVGFTARNGGVTIDNMNYSFDMVWYDEDGFNYIESACNQENKVFKYKCESIESAHIDVVIDFDDDAK